jgi:PTH1 family peptidyl-tRNA hydrolase
MSPQEPILLIVGLGNPGPKYEGTRHNVGAAAIARLARILKVRLKRSASLGAWTAKKGEVTLARPDAFMNLSGPAVARLAKACRTATPLIVSDDLDLPLGTIRFRTRGSAGGHRGLGSIIAYLGTGAFPRLKIGIGRPPIGIGGQPGEARNYVLEEFTAEEKETCENAVNCAAEALRTVVTLGLDRAMTLYSK